MSLRDWEIAHIREALRKDALEGCNTCKCIREQLKWELQRRRSQRRIIRDRNRRGVYE